MNKFWLLIYNIFILPSLYLLLRIAGIFSGKIRTGISGRKRLFEDLVLNNRGLDKTKKVIWIHSSSLGEFEQAKPIIEKLWQQKKFNIIVTFFSPSGYENSKNYPYANLITYIPFDTKSNAERFIKIVQPDLSVLMRYDIWPNFIAELKKFEIPCYIVDATMRKNSSRAIPVIKSFHKGLFADITRILTVSKSDAKAFKIFKVKDRKSTRLNSSHTDISRMPSSA